jgi:putative Mn2+ efflux pump MntP
MSESFSVLLNKILSKIELVSLALVGIGLSLIFLDRTEGNNLLLVGMSSLAMVYFLTAFRPWPDPETVERVKKGFMDLLPLLLWKVMYIACSVEVIGLLFYLLQLKGFGQLLLIGTFALVFSLIVAVFLISRKNEILNPLQQALIRGLMLMIMGLYILYTHWPPES